MADAVSMPSKQQKKASASEASDSLEGLCEAVPAEGLHEELWLMLLCIHTTACAGKHKWSDKNLRQITNYSYSCSITKQSGAATKLVEVAG